MILKAKLDIKLKVIMFPFISRLLLLGQKNVASYWKMRRYLCTVLHFKCARMSSNMGISQTILDRSANVVPNYSEDIYPSSEFKYAKNS